MHKVAKQVLMRWTRIAHQLTSQEAVQILRSLDRVYLREWVAVYNNGKVLSGSFQFLAKEFGHSKQWYKVPCQFVGGPTNQTFCATLGVFVADCMLREIRRHGSLGVYKACYDVLRQNKRLVCLLK